MRLVLLPIFLVSLFFSVPVFAQEVHSDVSEIVRAEVIDIVSTGIRSNGFGPDSEYQMLRVKILSGERKNSEVIFENDLNSFVPGNILFLSRNVDIEGKETFFVLDPDRRFSLFFLLTLFVAVVIFFSGLKGARSLFSLGLSFLFIIFVFLPLLLSGINPVLVSVVCGSIILALVMIITHGWNKTTHASLFGTIGAIIFTGVLSSFVVKVLKLSGFGTDEAVYLNLQTGGSIPLEGLLLGGIIIGLLGVLDDIAITQASVVKELFESNPNLSPKDVYSRAMNVGKDHIGALVNTLALVYVGASLPLLLLFSLSDASLGVILSREVFAGEITRTAVGGIGLVLAAPLTTFIAVWMNKK